MPLNRRLPNLTEPESRPSMSEYWMLDIGTFHTPNWPLLSTAYEAADAALAILAIT